MSDDLPTEGNPLSARIVQSVIMRIEIATSAMRCAWYDVGLAASRKLEVVERRWWTYMNPTLAIPVRATSNPTPPPPPPPVVGVKSSRFNFASLALS